jgi:short-subunit dehydrogenase
MVPHGRGHLLNVSNFQASPRLASYSATKADIKSLTEALYEEMRGTGVRVTDLYPGFTPTELSEVSGATSIASQVPSFAWLEAKDVAREGFRTSPHGKALSVPGAL